MLLFKEHSLKNGIINQSAQKAHNQRKGRSRKKSTNFQYQRSEKMKYTNEAMPRLLDKLGTFMTLSQHRKSFLDRIHGLL